MVNPRSSLAIDAAPIAPYDDGFSTETEDDDVAEDTPEWHDSWQQSETSTARNGAGIAARQSKAADGGSINPQDGSGGVLMVQGRGATLWVDTKTGREVIEIDDDDDDEEEMPHTEEKTHTSTNTTEEGEQEDGEILEEACKCCYAKLMPLDKRVRMMQEAMRAYGGKKPPASRQCACCRITYPSEGLTKMSRKTTRAVPICSVCSKVGGSAIYEMLAVSDEFIKAFTVENPEMARQFLDKKAQKVECAEAQRRRTVESMKKRTRSRVFGGLPVQTGGDTNTESEKTSPRKSRSARWIEQFEIVNGKTTRERRLETRNNDKAKRQRTS